MVSCKNYTRVCVCNASTRTPPLGVSQFSSLHPSRARDRPDKARSIEIYNATDFCRMRQHWNGCGLLLHEYCHLIHQAVLGLCHARVLDLYHDAQQSGLYQQALRRDWTGESVEHDMHYCMVDHKEFFAELSVTYWSKGYRELDQPTNTQDMEACSPPIQEPIVRKRLLLRNYKGRLLDPVTPEKGHCNKFYPFTSGQLLDHDPELYQRMALLWDTIAAWKDSEKDASLCCTRDCWTPWPSLPKTKPIMVTSDTVSL